MKNVLLLCVSVLEETDTQNMYLKSDFPGLLMLEIAASKSKLQMDKSTSPCAVVRPWWTSSLQLDSWRCNKLNIQRGGKVGTRTLQLQSSLWKSERNKNRKKRETQDKIYASQIFGDQTDLLVSSSSWFTFKFQVSDAPRSLLRSLCGPVPPTCLIYPQSTFWEWPRKPKAT